MEKKVLDLKKTKSQLPSNALSTLSTLSSTQQQLQQQQQPSQIRPQLFQTPSSSTQQSIPPKSLYESCIFNSFCSLFLFIF